MNKENIDFRKLRSDMTSDSLGAAFGGGFGGAFMETNDINKASNEELLNMADKQGIDIERYTI